MLLITCVFRNMFQIALFKTGDKGQGQREEKNFLDSLQCQALGLGVWVALLIPCRKTE